MIALYTDKQDLKTDIRLRISDIIDNLTQQIDEAEATIEDLQRTIKDMNTELEGTMHDVDELNDMLGRLDDM
jgi:peptidoglycan hydrolase CwlO-like protein